MIRVLIGGDVFPSGRNKPMFQQGDSVGLFGNILQNIREADLSVVNLECPLIHENTPIKKIGMVLGADEACINGIKASGIDVLNLANNHIMDHGAAGLENTINLCINAGIGYVGAGQNLAAAGTMYIRKVKDLRVGILSFAEHEFSIATKAMWGANPLDVIEFVRKVQSHRSGFDYLIVLLHGGSEYYPFPSPSLQNVCRFFVEQGANAVICQHSHCAGCYENYRNAHIVYGQGNFIFEPPSNQDSSWHEGFLVTLHIEHKNKSEMEITPYTQSGLQAGVQRMPADQEEKFFQDLRRRSDLILDEEFVEAQWAMFCRARKRKYLSMINANNLLTEIPYREINFLKCLISKQSLRKKLNLIRCESHRDILIRILSEE
jgi:poly-gamma-glutamate synthesis protein (capsule biosynthesis protein)